MAFSEKNQEIIKAGKKSLREKVNASKEQGLSIKQIAEKLGLAESTVRHFLDKK